jgi:biotin--protein ligase
MENIFIYNDEGTDEFSFNELKSSLKTFYPNLNIQKVDSNDIKRGILFQKNGQLNAKLFCIGGGRDLGYLKMLGVEGCEEIKNYVHLGGIYLGICAGAYFAADYIEFDLNGPIEVKGERMLKFFNGKAVGPINKTFKYNTESEAIAIEIEFMVENLKNQYYYLNGGCEFIAYDDKNLKIIAKYTNHSKNPAIIECNYGRGKSILSGIHVEYNPDNLNKKNEHIRDYVLPKLMKTKEEEEISIIKILLN